MFQRRIWTMARPRFTVGLLLSLFCPFCLLNAQERVISGEASSLMNNPAITKYQYEEETYRMAVNNAIDQAFGSSVISNYERLTSTQMEGRSVTDHFDLRNNYLNTFPNGVWIKDQVRECLEEKDEEGNWWMTCKVTGIARKQETTEVQFVAKTLDGTNPEIDQTETFIVGESGYLYFKSPGSGYIVVFYNDMNIVQRCIPYNDMSASSMKVEANMDYIFFSPEHAHYTGNISEVDEIEFYTDLPLEYNQFYILFSHEPFKEYFLDPARQLEDGYSGFKSMSRERFHKWLQENRVRNKALQVQILSVMISNNSNSN